MCMKNVTVLLNAVILPGDYIYEQSGLTLPSADSSALPTGTLCLKNSPVNSAATPSMSGA